MDKSEVYQKIEDHYRANFEANVQKMARKCGGHAQAQDVVQEAYTRACQYWDSYDVDQDFDKWFGGILYKAFLSSRKKERNALTITEDVSPVSASLGDTVMAQELKEIIEEKPEVERKVLLLFFFFEYTPQDIEQLVPLSGNAIRKMISRFKQDARKEYAQ